MALNALRTEVVSFTGTPGIEVNGITVGYKAEYTPRTSTESKYNAIEGRTSDVATEANHKGQYYIQLGEQLYDGDLRLTNYDIDAFGRPARTWEYDGNQIGTYMKKELLKKEYTVEVTGKDLYDLLTKNTIEEYDFEITIDGETEQNILTDKYFFTEGNLVRTNTKGVGGTGKGVLTQVFVDNNSANPTVYIAIINTYLAIADSDYNEKKEEASFTIYHINSVNSNKALLKNDTLTVGRSVKNEDINVEDVKKDDIVLVRVAENEIKEVITPEILSDKTISAFKKDSWIRTDGTQYDEANTALYDAAVLNQYSNNNMKDVTYNVILDMYGYMIGIEQNEDPDQYVFITGNDGGSSDLRDKEADLAAIFLDGTMEVIKVDTKKSTGLESGAIVNKWYTYTKNDNDVYTLKAIGTSYGTDEAQWAQNVNDKGVYKNANSTDDNPSYTIDKAHVALVASSNGKLSDRRVYGNDDTVYLNVSTDVIGTKTQYVGTSTTITGNGYSDNAATPDTDNSNFYATTTKKLAVIIDDVDSVTVGVKNANLLVSDVKASQYDNGAGSKYADGAVAVPKSEIYTLYDSDGTVIAAVVIGEDQGTTSQYAYVHSSNVKFEEYGHKNDSTKAVEGKWSWEREVIIDGEIVTLTEVEDSDWAWIEPDNMLQGEWYKVSFNADGQVRKTEKATEFPANRWATDVDLVETYHDLNQDLVILEVNYTGTANIHAAANGGSAKAVPIADRGHLTYGLRFENGTLYTDYANRKGFSVSPDVKVVYANAELKSGKTTADCGTFANVDWFDETYDSYTGYSGVEHVLKLIDSRDTNYFCGVLNAVLENGVATSIIINDTYGEYVDRGGAITPPDKDGYPNIIKNAGNNHLEIRWYDKTPTSAEVEQLISNAANGETVKYSSVLGNATIGTGLNATVMSVDLIRVFKLSINGTPVDYVDSNAAAKSNYQVAASTVYLPAGTAVAGSGSADAASANTTSTSGGVLDLSTAYAHMSADVNLVPAYQIKLDDGVAGVVGGVTLYNTNTTYYNLVAKDANIALTLTGINDGNTYQFSSSVDGAFGTSKVLAANTDKLEGTRTAAKNETIGATSVVRVYVKTATGTTPVDLASTSTTAGVLADAAGVKNADYGKYLAALNASGEVTGTPTALSSSTTAVTVTAGTTYEFGYYKVTKLASPKTAWTNSTITMSAPAADVYAKKNDTVDLELTVASTNNAAATTDVTITMTGGKFSGTDGSVLTAKTGTTPANISKAEKTSDTVLTFAAADTSSQPAGVYTVTITVDGDVSFS